jgi:hypothetical protein
MNNLSKQVIEIEQSISLLSSEEQLWLIERIVHNMRVKTLKEFSDIRVSNITSLTPETIEKQLSEMANDPAIQGELAAINQEFANTEMDGLGEQ